LLEFNSAGREYVTPCRGKGRQIGKFNNDPEWSSLSVGGRNGATDVQGQFLGTPRQKHEEDACH